MHLATYSILLERLEVVVYSKAYARYVRMHGLPPLLDPIHNRGASGGTYLALWRHGSFIAIDTMHA